MRVDYANLILMNFIKQPDYIYHLNLSQCPLTSIADHHEAQENNCMRLMIKNLYPIHIKYWLSAISYYLSTFWI